MTAEYNLPLHVTSQNGDDYVIEDGYPHDGVTPPGMGWDGQGDGGGKFRLKRRRRCGQCAPCQVKENCNKCQYCMRKDVLKQACIYRKCVYLRKPVPRFRQDVPVGATQKTAPIPPRKPATTQVSTAVTNSSNNNSNSSTAQNVSVNTTTSAPASTLSSPASIPSVASSHQSELSSCRLNQSPFAALSAMNNSMLDPLRHRMMEHQHRSSLFDTMGHHHSVLDPSKTSIGDMSRYPAGPGASGFNSAHCKLDQGAASMNHSSDMNLAAAAAAAVSPLNSMSGHHGHHQANKALPPRDPYFPSMDTWSSMPYALPRPHSWAPPALPNHHAAAAAYGFQQHSTPFPSSFTPSSCRLGLPDSAASRYASPQHSFHHSMAGFSQDLTHATANHANHSSMRSPMNTHFYPTAPHIAPSGIPGFTSLGQFPPNQAGFGPAAYPMHPHAHMYPGGFYSTFRTATEPQIYHVEIFPSQNPFKHFLSLLPTFSANFTSEKEENFNDKILSMNICNEMFDKPYGKEFISGISPVKNFVEKGKEYLSEDIDLKKENIPSHHQQVWNESCMKDWRNVKQPIAVKRIERSLGCGAESLFIGCKLQTKGSQKSFQKSNKDQEILDRLDKLSYLPECLEIYDFTSLSCRLSDDVESDVDSDAVTIYNHSDPTNSREVISMSRTLSSESTPPLSYFISQPSSGLHCPSMSHCVPKTAFSSFKVWPSSSSDHSAYQPVTGGLNKPYQRLNKPRRRVNKSCPRVTEPCHRVRRHISVALQSIRIKKKYLSHDLNRRNSTHKNNFSSTIRKSYRMSKFPNNDGTTCKLTDMVKLVVAESNLKLERVTKISSFPVIMGPSVPVASNVDDCHYSNSSQHIQTKLQSVCNNSTDVL